MEGTRHEKIVLVVVSYVIGFITAFIAFGMKSAHAPVVVSTKTITTEVAQATPQADEDMRISDVGFGSDGLFVMTDGYERIISADKNVLSANVIATTEDAPGFFFSIIDAEASRDGKFAYFCEQRVAEAEECYPYVYSIADDTVHAVKVNGEVYTSPIASHESSWSENGTLSLNQMVSADAQSPWVFATNAQ